MNQPVSHKADGLIRFRIDLSYDGTDYWGWAMQPGIPSVQGELVSTWQDARLYAAAVGMAAYFWRRDVLVTILAGMAVYLPLHLGWGW